MKKETESPQEMTQPQSLVSFTPLDALQANAADDSARLLTLTPKADDIDGIAPLCEGSRKQADPR
jgi:hypothetical protein